MYMLQKQIRLMTISIFQYFLILVTIKLLLVCPNYNYLHLFLLILNIIQIKTTLSKTNVSINEIERSLNKVILTSMILFFFVQSKTYATRINRRIHALQYMDWSIVFDIRWYFTSIFVTPTINTSKLQLIRTVASCLLCAMTLIFSQHETSNHVLSPWQLVYLIGPAQPDSMHVPFFGGVVFLSRIAYLHFLLYMYAPIRC